MAKRKTHDEFVNEANAKFNSKFTYPEEYKGAKIYLNINCPIHGLFPQKPNDHLCSKFGGCPDCANEMRSSKDTFEQTANNKFNYKFKYSGYKNSYTEISIICPIHDTFSQTPHVHLHTIHGCPDCALDSYTYSFNKFVELSTIKHNYKYTYPEQDNYSNTKDIVNINCPIHGLFPQLSYVHLKGHGCPDCNDSRGELDIKKIIKNNNIIFKQQYRFKDCVDKIALPFDFYLPEYNICIEFDGIQHFNIIDSWGGESRLLYTKKHDQIKNEYCKNNNIHLLRIKYDENIEEKLTMFLKDHNVI